MNYTKHYEALIYRAKGRVIDGYKERHHIIPKCVGGSNLRANLVYLTPEEHFVAHQLLVKIYPDNRSLVYALSACCMSKNGIRNNKMFGWIRRKNILARSGGKQSDESNKKRQKTLLGRKTSTGMAGVNHREESKALISKAQLGKMKNSPRAVYAWINNPSGEKILFGPLLHECKEYGLNLDYVSDLCKGKKLTYKGWSFLRMATAEERLDKIVLLQDKELMF